MIRGFVNDYMNEFIIGMLFIPPIAVMLFIVAITRATKFMVK
jgi:hypothetical protein